MTIGIFLFESSKCYWSASELKFEQEIMLSWAIFSPLHQNESLGKLPIKK